MAILSCVETWKTQTGNMALAQHILSISIQRWFELKITCQLSHIFSDTTKNQCTFQVSYLICKYSWKCIHIWKYSIKSILSWQIKRRTYTHTHYKIPFHYMMRSWHECSSSCNQCRWRGGVRGKYSQCSVFEFLQASSALWVCGIVNIGCLLVFKLWVSIASEAPPT